MAAAPARGQGHALLLAAGNFMRPVRGQLPSSDTISISAATRGASPAGSRPAPGDIVRDIKVREQRPFLRQTDPRWWAGIKVPSSNSVLPCITMRPASGVSNPARIRSSVVFPSRTARQWPSGCRGHRQKKVIEHLHIGKRF
jgi:hypothetical protein